MQRHKGYKGWPPVPVSALAAEPAAVEGILAAIQQLIDSQEASA